MTEMLCRCEGIFTAPQPCEEPATQEDGLCDRCRENDCESQREELLDLYREAAQTNPRVGRILRARGLL